MHVGVRLVGLHHRELGVVARRQALVAEHPADLEDAVHAADDQPLEVQLEGDAQVQRHVERVVVGDERAGVGAAGLDVQHRRLDLDEAPSAERAAEAGDDRVADVERPAGLGVDDEVDVALAEAGVGVGQAVPLVGQRAQRLGEQLEAVDLDRQLAGAGRHHRAVGADPVAAVELLDVGEAVVADDRLGDEQLELDAAVGDRGEHELAGVALEQDPAGDADLRRRSPCPARGRATRRAPRRRCGCGRSGTGTARARAAGARRPAPGGGPARPPGRCPAPGSRWLAHDRVTVTRRPSSGPRPVRGRRRGPFRPGRLAWRRDDALRDHRRRTGRQHGGHLRRPARRPGDDGRARRRRRRRPPVGLHPVEDDDRHRRGDGVPQALDRDGPRGRCWPRSTPRRWRPASRASRTTCRDGTTGLLASQGVRMIRGTARFVGPYEVEVTGVEGTERIGVRRRPRSPPARGRASPSGARPTATASSRPATATRRRCSRSRSPSSARA